MTEIEKIIKTIIKREQILEIARKLCKEKGVNYSEYLSSDEFYKMAEKELNDYFDKLQPPKVGGYKIDEKPTGIVVDASTTGGNPGYCECRGVDLQTGEIIFSEQIGMATNNIAEFLAIAYGANYIKEKNLDCTLWSDSKIAINWYYQKKCKTDIFSKYPQKAKENPKLAQQISEGIEIAQKCKVDAKFWNKFHKGENPADYGRK